MGMKICHYSCKFDEMSDVNSVTKVDDNERKRDRSEDKDVAISNKEQRRRKYKRKEEQRLLARQRELKQQENKNVTPLRSEWLQNDKGWITWVSQQDVDKIAEKIGHGDNPASCDDDFENHLACLLRPYRNLQQREQQNQSNNSPKYFIAEGTETVRLLIQQHRLPYQRRRDSIECNTTGTESNSVVALNPNIQIQSIFLKPNLLFDKPVYLQKDIEEKFMTEKTDDTDNSSNDDHRREQKCRTPPFHVMVATEEILSQIAGFTISRGALACGIVPLDRDEEWLFRYLRYKIEQYECKIDYRTTLRLLALDGISDTANLGSVIRCASAFGIDAILLSSDCCDPWCRRSVRVSMGHVARVPCIRLQPNSLSLILGKLSHHPYNVTSYAAVIDPITDMLLEKLPKGSITSWCCVIGNEANGISQNVRSTCSYKIRIGMESGVDSLSVPVATGIFLHGLKERE